VARTVDSPVSVDPTGRHPAQLSPVRRVFVLTQLLAVASLLPLHAQFFAVSQLGGPLTISAPWRFHTGDNPDWASPTFDDSQWPLLGMNRSWNVQGFSGYSGYGWYRIRLQLPASKDPLALGIAQVGNSAEIYADGKLIGVMGRMRPTPDWLNSFPETFTVIPLPPTLGGGTIEVAIRAWQSPLVAPSLAAFSSPLPVLGTEQAIRALHNLSLNQDLLARLPDWFLDLVALVIGQISFGLFFLRPRATEYAWAGLYLFAHALMSGFELCRRVYQLPMNGSALTSASMSAGETICWLFLIWGFMRSKADWLLGAGILLALHPPILTLLAIGGLMTIPRVYVVGALLALCIGLLVFARLVHEAGKGNRDAQIFLVPFLLHSVMDAVGLALFALYWLGLYRFGKADTFGLVLYRGPYFTVTWAQLGYLLSCLAIGAVLVRRFTRSAEQEQRLAAEMESARQVQAQLVPSEFPNLSGFHIEAAYLPASEVGGDFYQVLDQGDGSVLIVIGDVCGKGLKAAMTGVLAIGAIRALASQGFDPGWLLTRLNREIARSQNGGFITCICARVNSDGAITLANAGHPSPYLNGEEIQLKSSLPLGITPDVEYAETRVRLAPGDCLTFLSDGVVEARGDGGGVFGFDRTREISRQAAQAIATAAQQFGQEDDITVLTLSFTPLDVVTA